MPKVTTNAAAVFNELLSKHKIPNDSQLSNALDVSPSMVSAMRSQRIPLGKAMEGRITDRKMMSARRIKELLES